MFLEGHFQIMPLNKPKILVMEIRLHLYWFIAYVIQKIKPVIFMNNMPYLKAFISFKTLIKCENCRHMVEITKRSRILDL